MVEPPQIFPPNLSVCVSKVSVINLNMEREEKANVVICMGLRLCGQRVWMTLQHFSKFLKIVFTKFKFDFERTNKLYFSIQKNVFRRFSRYLSVDLVIFHYLHMLNPTFEPLLLQVSRSYQSHKSYRGAIP